MRKLSLVVAAFLVTALLLAPPVQYGAEAAGWAETGDAGDLLPTAQDTVGVGNLDFISGTIFTLMNSFPL